MKKKVLSVALASSLAFLAVPFAASAQAAQGQGTDQASQIRISGAIDNHDYKSDPKDGILGINSENGEDCSPDVHSFDISDPRWKELGVPPHIVFAAQVTPESQSPNAPSQEDLYKATMEVLIYGKGGQLVETINMPHNQPKGIVPHASDSVTGNQFYVRCVWLDNAFLAGQFSETLLPTGDYTYKFQATYTDSSTGKQHVRTWVPSDNTFTISDSSQH